MANGSLMGAGILAALALALGTLAWFVNEQPGIANAFRAAAIGFVAAGIAVSAVIVFFMAIARSAMSDDAPEQAGSGKAQPPA